MAVSPDDRTGWGAARRIRSRRLGSPRPLCGNTREGLAALFTQLRDYNVRMLRSLTPEEWSRRGLHAERGETSVRDLATHMAGHDRNHVRQIQEILSSDLESE